MTASHDSSRHRGLAIEAEVARWLEARGLVIIDQNAVAAGAELDLVARDERASEPTIVFVEVRSRRQTDLGDPLETIDLSKRRRVSRGACGWLLEHELWERVAVRFDVVAVVGEPGGSLEITWLRDAFGVGS